VPRRKKPVDLALRTEEVAIASAADLKVMLDMEEKHGHPYVQMQELAASTEEDSVKKGAIAELLARRIPPLRSLEVESEQKPMPVSININLNRADE
jgi:hypothetical protein